MNEREREREREREGEGDGEEEMEGWGERERERGIKGNACWCNCCVWWCRCDGKEEANEREGSGRVSSEGALHILPQIGVASGDAMIRKNTLYFLH